MRYKFLTVIFSLWFLSGTVFANVFEHEQNLAFISDKLPALESITCKFRQEKVLPPSGAILKSSGDFVYEKNKGVTFYTTYPIKTVSSYTSKEYRQISSIINAISNKSYSKIEKEFRFFYTGEKENWHFGLLPKPDSAAYNYLKSVEIEGNSKKILKITILPVDLTKTTIWFGG